MPQNNEQPKDTVLITGATGFIGEALCRRLSEDFTVVALDLKPLSRPIAGVDFIQMDVSSNEGVLRALQTVNERYGRKLASVIHLAAYYSFSGEPSSKYDEVTVKGTERLLGTLETFDVDQFVFSSTMLVHAPLDPEEGEVTERAPIEPKWDYPKSKVEAERIIRERHGGIPYVILRIAGVYDDRGHSIPIANQIQRVFERQISAHLYPADVARGQAFIHVDDLVEAIRTAVVKRKVLPGSVSLLIGEPETMSYESLQNEIGRLLFGRGWKTLRIPKTLAKAGAWIQGRIPFLPEPFIKPFMIDLADDHYDLDITRAREVLGWVPKRTLAETLPKIIGALKADPEAWYRENKLVGPSWMKIRTRRVASVLFPTALIAGGAYFAWSRIKRRRSEWARQ